MALAWALGSAKARATQGGSQGGSRLCYHRAMAPGIQVSVIVPTLNAGKTLPATLRALAPAIEAGLVGEVIVADGGLSDTTRAIAAEHGARVVQSMRGRGVQLAMGAAAANGDWFLFLHADTVLSESWHTLVRAFIEAPSNEARAAVFRFALDDPDPRARRIERLARWRGRVLGLPYGDQGLLIARAHHERVGGFKPLPLMEDVDLVRRIGRRNIVELDADAVTSAARYRKGGWWLRPLRNLSILTLYFFGVSPNWLRRLYG
jgi:rSAM/selenodomain-associated transferase 2